MRKAIFWKSHISSLPYDPLHKNKSTRSVGIPIGSTNRTQGVKEKHREAWEMEEAHVEGA